MQDTQGLRPAGMMAHTLGFRIFFYSNMPALFQMCQVSSAV